MVPEARVNRGLSAQAIECIIDLHDLSIGGVQRDDDVKVSRKIKERSLNVSKTEGFLAFAVRSDQE